jgi:hypothetical protein
VEALIAAAAAVALEVVQEEARFAAAVAVAA